MQGPTRGVSAPTEGDPPRPSPSPTSPRARRLSATCTRCLTWPGPREARDSLLLVLARILRIESAAGSIRGVGAPAPDTSTKTGPTPGRRDAFQPADRPRILSVSRLQPGRERLRNRRSEVRILSGALRKFRMPGRFGVCVLLLEAKKSQDGSRNGKRGRDGRAGRVWSGRPGCGRSLPRPAPHVRHRVIAKADIVRVQEWMGHADIQTTRKYLHYVPAPTTPSRRRRLHRPPRRSSGRGLAPSRSDQVTGSTVARQRVQGRRSMMASALAVAPVRPRRQ